MSWLKGKLAKTGLILTGALLGVSLLLLGVLLGTEWGGRTAARYGLDALNNSGAIDLEVSEISGTLYSGLRLSEVSLRDPSVHLTARNLNASWDLWTLLRGEWIIESVQLSQLHLELPEPTDAPNDSSDPAPVDLPLIAIPQVTISGFTSTIDPRLNAQRVAASVSMGGNELTIGNLEIDAESFDTQAELKLTFNAVLGVDLDAQWQLAENTLPDVPAISGRTNARGDLSQINLEQEIFAPYNISSVGTLSNLVDVDALEFSLRHSINLTGLPQFPPELSAMMLSLSTQGTLQQVALQAEGEVELASFPTHQVRLSGNWSEQQLSLSSYELGQGSTTLSGAMTLDLDGALALAGTYSLESFNPLDYFPELANNAWLPLDIDGEGAISLENINSDLQLLAEIDHMRLLARDNEIAGSGRLEWVEGEFQIDQFQLESETTQVLFDGSIGSSNSLVWQLEIESLGQFVADATGSVQGSGRILGTRQAPFVSGTLRLNNLSLGPVQATSIAATVEGSPDQYQADLNIQEFDLDTPGFSENIRRGDLQIQGDPESFTLSLATESELGSIAIGLDGGPLQQNPWRWQGDLVEAEFRSGRNWVLASPVPLSLSTQQLDISNTCLASNTVTLCFELDSTLEQESGSYAVTLAGFPLEEISEVNQVFPFRVMQNLPVLLPPQGVSFSGNLDGSLIGGYSAAAQPRIEFSLSSSNPVMLMQQLNEMDSFDMVERDAVLLRDYRWSDVSLSGQMENANWNLAATGNLVEQTIDGITYPLQGNLDLVLDIGSDQSLNGRSQAEFNDLSWLEFYVPDLSSITGELSSDFILRGSLEQPRLGGYFTVRDSGFSLDRWGVRIDQFEGTLTADENGLITVDARAAAEEGELRLEGTANNLLVAGTSLALRLSGTDFQLLDTEDLSVRVSPDLRLTASESEINVAGSIFLPQVLITMENVPESAIDVSSDVVIVNYPADDMGVVNSLAAEQSRFLNIPISAELDIQLGEEVRFEGLGLATRLAGQLDMELLENGSNRTFGELTITEGSYSLYGQTLQIEEGELLFLGPYDNPGLDIRATRTVDSQVVGVHMNGTLRNIRSELFSTPSLPEAEVVALIVTGRPFSSLGNSDETALLGSIARLGLARGRGISERFRNTLGLDTLAITNTGDINNSLLTVGKYLSPSLFVRYGLGLFDNQSKVAVDYELTETLKLQAESGEYQSLDLTYSIERD